MSTPVFGHLECPRRRRGLAWWTGWWWYGTGLRWTGWMIAQRTREPLTDDAIPVTRLLTTSSGSHLFHSRRRQSFRATQLIPTRPEVNGDTDPYVLISILARRTTYRPCKRFRKIIIEQVTMYSCTVRMLLLPCLDFPNVELNPGQRNDP